MTNFLQVTSFDPLLIDNTNKGDKGDPGAPGATPNLQVGTVTTAPSGSPASASISGTAANPILNLTLPAGPQGSAGTATGTVQSVAAADSTITVGGTTANPTVKAAVGTTTGTVAAGDDSRITGAVQSTRQVLAGTGLSGGGTLAADRTISMPNVGTAGTYGDSTHTLTVTTDAQGRVSAITTNPVAASSPFNVHTGQHYGLPYLLSGAGSAILTLNQLCAYPFFIGNSATLTSFTMRVASAVTNAKLRLGLYADNGGVPGSLILDAGQADISGSVQTIVSLSVSQALTPPLVWVAWVGQTAAGILQGYSVSSSVVPPPPIPMGTNDPNLNLNPVFTASAAASGALPSTFGALAANTAVVPKILLGF